MSEKSDRAEEVEYADYLAQKRHRAEPDLEAPMPDDILGTVKAAFMAGYYAEWEGPPLWSGRWVFDPRDCGGEPEEVFAAWQKSKARSAEEG
jgi:hypothetical protein